TVPGAALSACAPNAARHFPSACAWGLFAVEAAGCLPKRVAVRSLPLVHEATATRSGAIIQPIRLTLVRRSWYANEFPAPQAPAQIARSACRWLAGSSRQNGADLTNSSLLPSPVSFTR